MFHLNKAENVRLPHSFKPVVLSLLRILQTHLSAAIDFLAKLLYACGYRLLNACVPSLCRPCETVPIVLDKSHCLTYAHKCIRLFAETIIRVNVAFWSPTIATALTVHLSDYFPPPFCLTFSSGIYLTGIKHLVCVCVCVGKIFLLYYLSLFS